MSNDLNKKEPIRREFDFSNVARFKDIFMDSYYHMNPPYEKFMQDPKQRRAFGNAIFYYRNRKEMPPSTLPVIGQYLPDVSMYRVGRHLALFGAMSMVSLLFLPHKSIEVGIGVATIALGALVKYAEAQKLLSDEVVMQNAFANCYSKAQEVYDVPVDASMEDKIAAFDKILDDPDHAEWVENAKEHAAHHSGSSRYGDILISGGAAILTTGFFGSVMEAVFAVSTLIIGGVMEYCYTKEAVEKAYSAVFGSHYDSGRAPKTDSGPAILDPRP